MTTLTMPADREQRAFLQPVPWRRMAWVTWRQHRLLLAGVALTFGAVAIYLFIMGLQMRDAYAAVTACRPTGSPACGQVENNFFGTYGPGVGVTEGILQLLPALVGTFAGVPILAREFETGTFRFAWTQGFGRTRWVIAKLVPLAIILTGVAVLIGMLFSWYYQPLISAGDDNGALFPTVFDLSGIALAGWTLAAFAIGAFAGVLLRRVVPAMFATLAVWTALAFATGSYLRGGYLAPRITTSLNEPHPAWIMSQGWTYGGKPAGLDAINQTLAAIDAHASTPQLFSPGPATPANVDPFTYLTQHGYALVTTYQPDSRFWTFQLIEGGWLLGLSVVLLGATVWLVRRRGS
jgi:ABC-type transport system involved in multi-copper enzyme maturation permease subunit